MWRKNAGRIKIILVSEAKKESEEPMLCCNFLNRGVGFAEKVGDAEDAIIEPPTGVL